MAQTSSDEITLPITRPKAAWHRSPVFLSAALFAASLVAIGGAYLFTHRAPSSCTYTVQEGDTALGVAKKMRLTFEELVSNNPGAFKENEAWCDRNFPKGIPGKVTCNETIGLDGRPLPKGAPPVPGRHRLMPGQQLNVCLP